MTKARDLANSAAAFSAVSATELGYVDGVTSAIQTQLDAKAASSTAVTLTGTQTLTNKTLTSPVIASVVNNTLTSTTGDIIYASAANTPARLGIGSSAQVLTVASGVPSWATPASATSFPTFSAYRNTSTQTISSGVYTKLQFNAEEWDTNSNYDSTTNYRFTPTVSGYYDINLQTQIYITSTGYIVLRLYFNGSSVRQMTTLTGVDLHPPLSALFYFNGSTDYVEAYAYCSGSGNFDNAAVNQGNYFSGIGIRS